MPSARISFIAQDMDASGRSCSGEAALDFESMDDNYDFHKPLASSFSREPPATAIRPPGQTKSKNSKHE